MISGRIIKASVLCIFLTAIVSCNSTSDVKDVQIIEAADYYPLAIGKYITYAVDSIFYFETIDNDTVRVEIKEVYTDTFRDGSDLLNYRLERYSRPAGTTDWTLVGTGTANYKNATVEKVENNMRFIKLTSPVNLSVKWDGHAYLGGLGSLPVDQECNNLAFLEAWEFCYTTIDENESIGDFNFSAVTTVLQNGSQNLIEYNQSEEKYAKGVGMVYCFFRHYTTQNICAGCIWEENTECGYSVRMVVINYN